MTSFDAIADYFGKAAEDDEAAAASKAGCARPGRGRPARSSRRSTTRLKALKLTLRNIPLEQSAPKGVCVFTGRPAVEEILIARAY